MKVLFYFGVFARNGGIEEFTRDLGLALMKSGVDVELVCASLKHRILDDLKNAGATIIRVPVYYGCRWRIPDLALLPVALFRVRSADIVVHRKPLMGWVYPFLSRKAKHIYITAYRPKEQIPDVQKRLPFFSWFDAVFTQTDSFKADLNECGLKRPVRVIPHIAPPIVECDEGDGYSEPVLRIGMLGRLEPQKNPAYSFAIIDALAKKIPDEYQSVEFNIYGSGSMESETIKMADSYDYNTTFHGRYARSDVAEIIQANDLFLITSFSEGQCIVALEILACGSPLFATSVGALPQILRLDDRGALIPESDAEKAATVISRWLNTHVDSNRQIIQQSYLKDYDATDIKKRYIALIQAVVGEK